MLNEKNTFNGSNTHPTTTFEQPKIYDEINFCPFCAAKVQNDFKFCPKCGKLLPRTYTGHSYVIHWNTSTGTVTYPLDGIVHPYTMC